MTFTNDERRLLLLYQSGSVADTADTLRDALLDTNDADERKVIAGILRKLDGMDEAEFDSYVLESEGLYAE